METFKLFLPYISFVLLLMVFLIAANKWNKALKEEAARPSKFVLPMIRKDFENTVFSKCFRCAISKAIIRLYPSFYPNVGTLTVWLHKNEIERDAGKNGQRYIIEGAYTEEMFNADKALADNSYNISNTTVLRTITLTKYIQP